MRTATKKRINPQAPMSFNQACAAYIHRFTMEHIPEWAKEQGPDGKFYAPQYRTDQEWYDNTKFPPHNPHARSAKDTSAWSTGQTWPLGRWLDTPYKSPNPPATPVMEQSGVKSSGKHPELTTLISALAKLEDYARRNQNVILNESLDSLAGAIMQLGESIELMKGGL